MNDSTMELDKDLDLKLPNLLPGPIGKAEHQLKTDKLLGIAYATHIFSVPVVQTLFGCTNSNANALLKRLLQKQLIRELVLPPNEFNLTGRTFMLTDSGLIRAQSVAQLTELHDYDLRPESVRRTQAAHDLAVAHLAASAVRGGATIIDSDLSLRGRTSPSDQRSTKLPDLVIRYQDVDIAFEIERAPKKIREVEHALLLASKTQRIPTIWLVNAPVTLQHFEKTLARGAVAKWKLSSDHKWSSAGMALLSHAFRQRQSICRLTMEQLNQPPQAWLLMVKQTAAEFDRRIAHRLKAEGWTWSDVQADQEYPGQAFFELQHLPSNENFFVCTHHGDGEWFLCRPDQPLASGTSLRLRTQPWLGGTFPPSLALVSTAAARTDLALPPQLREPRHSAT